MPTPSSNDTQSPFHPIIYVRGYAGSEDAVEETVATPYMGFNDGSSKVRQRWTGALQRMIFESPLVRLMKDHGYVDTYLAGSEAYLSERIKPRSVIIYRYYDQVSKDLDPDPERPDIPEFARGLDALIASVRNATCGPEGPLNNEARRAFRVYLVAHSMGGLICRCFLQNDQVGSPQNREAVDKVFTYATPHSGIDMRLVGNVPGFFSRNNVNNFNRKKMRKYLGASEEEPVNSVAGRFDANRFFCLVGTNCEDYDVASGWSRRMVGPMSDGLVRIENATVLKAPRAFVHRSHSGHYGIVNSEEGYQNLSRFLFGDVRVDGVFEVHELRLPSKVQKAKDKGKKVRASYHFETVVRVRGTSFDLHRRVVADGSAAFRDYDAIMRDHRHPHMFSTFLSRSQRVNKKRRSLCFSVDLRVLVPDYEIDGLLFFDDHIENTYLFRETVTLEALPPTRDTPNWTLKYGFDSVSPGRATRRIDATEGDEGLEFRIPLDNRHRPGLRGTLVLKARPWE